jgi:hypothetical protein
VDVQDAGQDESAESGTDDRDWGVHGGSFGIGPPGELRPAASGKVSAPTDEPPTSDRQRSDIPPRPQIN